MVAPAMPAGAQGPPIYGRFCGTPGAPIDPARLPGKSPDCPSPCHATCPRKHGGCDQDDSYTG